MIAPANAVRDALYGYEPRSGTELSGIAVQATSGATITLAQNEVQSILDEAHELARGLGVRTLSGQAFESQQAVPFGPLLAAIIIAVSI